MKVRFFCESCGKEVGRSDAVCPSCGKTFAAVRCPQCGFSGKASSFARGCPVCGYLHENRASVPVQPEQPSLGQPGPRRGMGDAPPDRRQEAERSPQRALSARFYRWAILILLAALVGLTVLFLTLP